MRHYIDTYGFPILCAFLPLLVAEYDPLEVLPLPDRLQQLALTIGIAFTLVGGIAVLSYCQSNWYSMKVGGALTVAALIVMGLAAAATTWLATMRDVSAGAKNYPNLLDVGQCVLYALFFVSALMAIILVGRLAWGIRRGPGQRGPHEVNR